MTDFDTPELEAYWRDMPVHTFPTEKPANEPYALDVVRGWWGEGVVTDVAETQGTCRVQVGSEPGFWIENSEIEMNVTATKIMLTH